MFHWYCSQGIWLLGNPHGNAADAAGILLPVGRSVAVMHYSFPRSNPRVNVLRLVYFKQELCIEPVMMVLERLSQDLLDGDSHLTQARKQQLRNALTSACKNGLLAFFSHTLLCHSQEDHLDVRLHTCGHALLKMGIIAVSINRPYQI